MLIKILSEGVVTKVYKDGVDISHEVSRLTVEFAPACPAKVVFEMLPSETEMSIADEFVKIIRPKQKGREKRVYRLSGSSDRPQR